MTVYLNIFAPGQRIDDDDGNPVASGTLEFYDAGTSTPRTVYSDKTLSTSLGTTVSLNSAGYPVTSGNARTLVYPGLTAFKVIAKDSGGSTLWTHDNVLCAVEITADDEIALPETPVVSKTAAYSIVDADQGKVINANCTGGSFVLTLPSAVTVGDGWRVAVRHTGSSNVVTIRTTSSQTIDIPGKQVTSFALKGRGQSVWLVSDGANWHEDGSTPALMQDGLPFVKITDRLTAPPTSPTGGNRYIANGTPSGAWATLSFAENQIIEADGNGSWFAYTPGDGWLAYVEDENLITQYRDSAWTDFTNITAPTSSTLECAVFEHQENNGTVGGTATTAAWTKRTLNTSVKNTITDCSLATSQITVPPGTYLVNFWQSLHATTGSQSRIKVISGTATPDPILHGYYLPYASDSGGDNPLSIVAPPLSSGILTVTATAVIELQYWVAGTAGGTSALGAVSAEPGGSPEVYARVTILDLASIQGPAGSQGTQGNDGLDATFDYQWNTATSGDPGAGKIRGNNATVASITEIGIHKLTNSAADIETEIATWDDSTSSVRSKVYIVKEGSPGNRHTFAINAAGTDQGDYWTFPVTYIGTAGTISNGNDVAVNVVRTGDKGDTGATGAAGADGAAGATGAPGSATSNSTFLLTGIISPTQITADQNDYSPTSLSTSSVLRLSSDASRNITGLAGGADGRIVIVHNVGAQNIALKDESASSTAANRFALPSDLTMLPDAVAVLQYDATSSRWRAISGGGSANPISDDGQSLGTTALKWSDLFLASGAVINFNSGDVTITHSANALTFQGGDNGYLFSHAVLPQTSDGAALGSTANPWSDLFLASGAVINWNNGDVTATHSANTLAFAGASSGYTFDAGVSTTGLIQAGTTLGISTDVLLNRDAANTLALRNSTSAQMFNVYNTYTDASNYECGVLAWSSNILRIGTTKAGTGSTRGLAFVAGGSVTTVVGDYSVTNTGAWTFSEIVLTGRIGAGIGVSNAWIRVAASTTSRAHITMEPGVAPSSPANGDIWFDGTDLKIRISGVTRTVTVS